MTDQAKLIADAADVVATELECDVLFYNGDISQSDWTAMAKLCAERARRKSVLLTLVSPGGDPDAAYKIGRLLQSRYEKVYSFIPGWCKSAGTLIAIASSTIFIGDMGELGPLDIQLAKQDELEEMASGLLMDATMRTLEGAASRMFLNFLKTIRRDTGISTRTASELAAKMVGGLLGPVFSQIEPMKVGENARALNITKAYGHRLNSNSKTLNNINFLEILLSAYPDHGFVIDRDEAKLIFKDVREPSVALASLSTALGDKALFPKYSSGMRDRAEIRYLSTEVAPGNPVKTGAAKSVNGDADGRAGEKGKGRRGSRERSSGVAGTGTRQPAHRANGSEVATGDKKGEP